MKNKLQKVKQWAKHNKQELLVAGAIVGTTTAVGSMVYKLTKGEGALDEIVDVIEDSPEISEVKIFLGGLNEDKDAGYWLVNMVEEFKDADGNKIEYSMDRIAADILDGNYKEI